MSTIEWTDATWNPIAGCRRVSPGCDHCYAIPISARFASNRGGFAKFLGTTHHDGGRLEWTGVWNFHAAALDIPRRQRRATIYFVNSMSDAFGEGVDDATIKAIFKVMNQTPQHTYQILTKRPHRAAKLASQLNWTPNIWMGTSIELNKYVNRAKELAKIPAALRFVSAEPLLSDLPSLDLTGIGWVIVGGESGTAKTVRPMDPQWARNIRDRCRSAGVPFFFKQWGAFDENGVHQRGKAASGHLLDGEELFEMPAAVSAAIAAKPKVAKSTTIIAAPALPIGPSPTTRTLQLVSFRDSILDLLKSGPLSGHDLRAANSVTTAPASTLHAQALNELQGAKQITRRADGRYALLIRVRAA